MVTAWDIIGELFDITVRGQSRPCQGVWGRDRRAGTPALLCLGWSWGDAKDSGATWRGAWQVPPTPTPHPGEGATSHSWDVPRCHPTTCSSLAKLRQQAKVPMPRPHLLVLGSAPPGRAESLLPPWRCFIPLGECHLAAAGPCAQILLSGSCLSFVWCGKPD